MPCRAVVHIPALAFKQDVQSTITKPAPLRRQFFQPASQFGVRRPLRHTSINAWIDTRQGAGPFLIVSLLYHGPARSFTSRSGPRKFFPNISLSVDTSIICSANSFFSLAFSASRDFSFLASDTSIPPYLDRHLMGWMSLPPSATLRV